MDSYNSVAIIVCPVCGNLSVGYQKNIPAFRKTVDETTGETVYERSAITGESNRIKGLLEAQGKHVKIGTYGAPCIRAMEPDLPGDVNGGGDADMRLADVLRKECIVSNAQFGNKAEAIRQVARLAKQCSVLENVSEQEILEELQAREAVGSTGVGKGVAIPHCRLKSVTEFVVGLITVPSGVDFDAIDAGKVKLIVFIVAPEVESNKHVRLLSVISQILLAPKVPERILSEQTSDGVYETCLRDQVAEIGDREGVTRSLIHVFVQNEDMFRDILQILAGVEASSLVVVGAENASVYLSKLPLFASFWTDEPSDFGRIIIAVVDKKLSNEIVRRVETVAGDLGKVAGVMVTVQDISYSAGSLGT